MKRLASLLFALLCCLAISSSALACACCAERGAYSIWNGAPDSYHLGLLKDISFGETAELYTTEAGFDSIRGLSSLQKEQDAGTIGDLNVVDEFTNNTWRLTIKTPGGKSGTLLLPRPATMVIYKVDTHRPEDEGREVTLYKEFYFKGLVSSGSGIFSSGIVRPTTYQLVFQGRGNNCDNAEDFTHWRLEIKGARAAYAFFGKMKSVG